MTPSGLFKTETFRIWIHKLAESSDDISDLYPEDWLLLEKERIILPSLLAPGEIQWLSLESIAKIKAELRKGQVTDALEGLRLALGEKSLCFRTDRKSVV